MSLLSHTLILAQPLCEHVAMVFQNAVQCFVLANNANTHESTQLH